MGICSDMYEDRERLYLSLPALLDMQDMGRNSTERENEIQYSKMSFSSQYSDAI
jgi:hypothetical protein